MNPAVTQLGSREGVDSLGNPINEKVGAWLLVDGNTRSSLAEALGISRQSLAGRLDGSAKWGWEEVVKLAEILGTTVNALAGMEG